MAGTQRLSSNQKRPRPLGRREQDALDPRRQFRSEAQNGLGQPRLRRFPITLHHISSVDPAGTWAWRSGAPDAAAVRQGAVPALLTAGRAAVEVPLHAEAAVELPLRAETAAVEVPLHAEAAVELPRRAEAVALPLRGEAAAVELPRRGEAAVVELPLRAEALVAELLRRAEALVAKLPLCAEALVAKLPLCAEVAVAELPRRAEASREARDYPEWSCRNRVSHLDLPARCRSRRRGCH